MKPNKETALLSRITGELETLMLLPLSFAVKGDDLEQVFRWQIAYRQNGLSFGQSKDDAELLRHMAQGGYIECMGGRTKSTSHKLTWRGLLASSPTDTITAKGMLVYLRTIGQLQGERKLTHGYELCPTAVEWFKGGDPTAYSDELASVKERLFPLLAMGWVTLRTDCDGHSWAVSITPAGREAVTCPPDDDTPVGTHFNFTAWREGCRRGMLRYPRTPPPPFTRNILVGLLSAAWAWDGCDKITAAADADPSG